MLTLIQQQHRHHRFPWIAQLIITPNLTSQEAPLKVWHLAVVVCAGVIYNSWLSIFMKKRQETVCGPSRSSSDDTGCASVEYQWYQGQTQARCPLLQARRNIPRIAQHGPRSKRLWWWEHFRTRTRARLNGLSILAS